MSSCQNTKELLAKSGTDEDMMTPLECTVRENMAAQVVTSESSPRLAELHHESSGLRIIGNTMADISTQYTYPSYRCLISHILMPILGGLHH